MNFLSPPPRDTELEVGYGSRGPRHHYGTPQGVLITFAVFLLIIGALVLLRLLS